MLVVVDTLFCQGAYLVSAYDDSKEYDLPKSFEAFAWRGTCISSSKR